MTRLTMQDRIVKILQELGEKSELEKSHEYDIPSEERMLAITEDTGRFFNILLRAKNAKNVLEVGMSVGYSTIWCSEAIKENNGKIISIEKNPMKIKRASENFQRAGISDMVEIKEKIASDALHELNKSGKYDSFFDFVLIDADKENTSEYFDLILPMVKIGGIIAIDNMLYPEKFRDHMKKITNKIRKNPKLNSVLVPIGNGEEITIKIE